EPGDQIATPLILPNGVTNIRLYDEHPLTTWFDSFLPDIDYDGNPDVVATVVNSAEYWIRQTDADGFRHDAVKHVPLQFWRALTNRIDQQFLDKQKRLIYQVGETISGYSTVSEYVGTDLLTGQFDFPTYFTLQNVLARGTGQMSDLAGSIRNAQANYGPASIMSPLLGNHDVARFMAFADGDITPAMSDAQVKELAFSDNTPKVDHSTSYKKLQLAFAFLDSLPAPPTLYYGDEIAMTGAGDPDNRRPMQWDGWNEDQKATHDLVAKLNHARAKSIALRRGATQILYESDERLVIARIAPEQTVLIVLNRAPKDRMLAMTLPSYWSDSPKLEELVVSGVKGSLKNRSLMVESDDYSFGIWEVKP
ncbi:MAG: alpha-amylase family glycosyl hydrolase, partial [Candidatus Sumerlaeota bacterium]